MITPLERLEKAEAEIQSMKAKTSAIESTLAELKPLLAEEPLSESLEEIESPIISPSSMSTPPPLPKPAKTHSSPRLREKEKPAKLPKPAKIDPQGFELEMGRVWFVRLGILLLLTGVVFLGNYAYQNYITSFGAGARLTLLYLGSTVVTGLGIFCEDHRESLKSYGRTLASGGLAAIYYTTFAAHNVMPLKVIESPVVAAFLLGVSALLFVAYARWRESPKIMTAALGMAFYSTAINPVSWMACLSALVLALIGVVTCLRQRWASVGFVSLIASYASFAWWQLLVGPASDTVHWFLPFYWILFTMTTFGKNFDEEDQRHSLFAVLNNVLFFGLFSLSLILNDMSHEIWKIALVFGGVILGLSFLKKPRIRAELLAQGIGLLTLSLIFKLSGYHLFLTLLIEALMLVIVSRKTGDTLFKIFSVGAAFLSVIFTLDLLSVPSETPIMAWSMACILWLVLGIMLKNEGENLITISGMLTSIMALAVLIFGAFHQLNGGEMTLTITSLGLASTLATRVPKLRLLGMEFWLLLQVIAVGASSYLLLLPDFKLVGMVLTASMLCVVYWKSGALSEAEIAVSDLLKFIYLILATIFTIYSIREMDASPAWQAVLYVSIPAVIGVLGKFLKEEKLRWIPSALYFGIFGLIFTNESYILSIATLGAGAHLALEWKYSKLREFLFALTAFFGTAWILVEIPELSSPVALSFVGTFLGCISDKIKTKSAGASSLIMIGLAILLSGFFFVESSAFYLVLFFPMVWGLWENYHSSRRYRLLAEVTLLLLWLKVSTHFEASLVVTWAILGTLALLTGLLTRNRNFRYLALIILGASLAHIGLVDVWKLEPLPRILSIMSLGVGLLGLGFVYNRWHERLKQWL